jgi:hypothetical protein
MARTVKEVALGTRVARANPHFSQGDGVPSGDCQNPKLY